MSTTMQLKVKLCTHNGSRVKAHLRLEEACKATNLDSTLNMWNLSSPTGVDANLSCSHFKHHSTHHIGAILWSYRVRYLNSAGWFNSVNRHGACIINRKSTPALLPEPRRICSKCWNPNTTPAAKVTDFSASEHSLSSVNAVYCRTKDVQHGNSDCSHNKEDYRSQQARSLPSLISYHN
jgi:hypothetical protein